MATLVCPTVSQPERATAISMYYHIDIIFIIINLLDRDPALPTVSHPERATAISKYLLLFID